MKNNEKEKKLQAKESKGKNAGEESGAHRLGSHGWYFGGVIAKRQIHTTSQQKTYQTPYRNL